MTNRGRFRRGRSGNPGGRPKEKPFKAALDMELKAAGEDHKKLRGIARKLIACAEKGESWAIREIADRLDGRPAQEITGDADQAPQIEGFTITIVDPPSRETATGLPDRPNGMESEDKIKTINKGTVGLLS